LILRRPDPGPVDGVASLREDSFEPELLGDGERVLERKGDGVGHLDRPAGVDDHLESLAPLRVRERREVLTARVQDVEQHELDRGGAPGAFDVTRVREAEARLEP